MDTLDRRRILVGSINQSRTEGTRKAIQQEEDDDTDSQLVNLLHNFLQYN